MAHVPNLFPFQSIINKTFTLIYFACWFAVCYTHPPLHVSAFCWQNLMKRQRRTAKLEKNPMPTIICTQLWQPKVQTVCYFPQEKLTKDCVLGVHGNLVLCGVADKSLCVREGHIGGGGAVSLIICNDLHLAMLKHTNTRVGGSQVNSNCWCLCHGASENQNSVLFYTHRKHHSQPQWYKVACNPFKSPEHTRTVGFQVFTLWKTPPLPD